MELVFGVDIGNGYVKIAGVDGVEVFASGLARVEETEDLLGKKNKDIVKIKSIKDEEEYYIGKDVVKMPNFITTNTGEGRYKNKYFKILAESSIAYAIKQSIKNSSEEKHSVKVVIGLPSREKSAKSIEETVIKAIEGNHLVEVDGVEIVFDVEVLKVVAQPLGTLFNYILGENRDLADKYVGIIDNGTGTTDIDGIKELMVVDGDRDTFQIGSYEAYQRVADYINKENIYANADFKQVEEQFDDDVYRISDRALVDISEEKDNIIKNLSDELVNKISIRWQNFTKFDVILLTGGSSSIYSKEIKRLIEDIEIVENPQLANAQGFYRYALLLIE